MKSTKPNILLITSDQQHWKTLGINNGKIRTPNLDKLARSGTVFNRAYCVNPTCTPTRASMITGQYPCQHGAWSLGTKLPDNSLTIGDRLKAAGRKTSLVGKAHFQPLASTPEYPSLESYPVLQDLNFWKNFTGPFYGFDEVRLARNHADEAHVGQHYALWMEQKGCKDWRRYFRKPTGTREPQNHRWNIPEELHYNTWIAEETCGLLRKYAGGGDTFFTWASFFDPHPPYLVPEPWDTMYVPDTMELPSFAPDEHGKNPPHFSLTQQEHPDFSPWRESHGNTVHGFHSHVHNPRDLAADIAVYYAMVSLMDKYIGRILDELRDLGLAENTLVVFTSDHGHFIGQHGLIAKGPFHYEDLVRVPFVVSLPGTVPANTRSEALLSLVDLTPTFCAFAGLEVPHEMAGLNQKDVWTGRTGSLRDHVLIENRHQPTTVHLHTCIDERYKITVYRNAAYGELFDLTNDPGETNNLWDENAYRDLKTQLLLRMVQAEMQKEPLMMPRVSGA